MPHDNAKHVGAWTFIGRALRLRCPECGVSPIFKPWQQTRGLFDWFRPLDGCPRCGYAYEREQGYFLLSIWALNYGLIAGVAVIVSFVIDAVWSPSMWTQIWCVFAPMPLFSFLFARHSKALFLALDHYCDPQANSDEGDGHEPRGEPPDPLCQPPRLRISGRPSHDVCSARGMARGSFDHGAISGPEESTSKRLEQLQERRVHLFHRSQDLNAELLRLSGQIDTLLAELAERQQRTPEQTLAENPPVD